MSQDTSRADQSSPERLPRRRFLGTALTTLAVGSLALSGLTRSAYAADDDDEAPDDAPRRPADAQIAPNALRLLADGRRIRSPRA